jgi:hypothetical protein
VSTGSAAVSVVPLITWCQPADDQQRDVILVNDEVLLPGADDQRRRDAVSALNEAAASGRRVDLPGRGWKSISGDSIAARIPVHPLNGDQVPAVAVLIPAPMALHLDRCVRQIVRTAELAGYSTNPKEAREALLFGGDRPKGLLARLWRWLVQLLRRVQRYPKGT